VRKQKFRDFFSVMPVFVKVGIAQMEMANFEFFKKISHTA
jgi:hypothetical protein